MGITKEKKLRRDQNTKRRTKKQKNIKNEERNGTERLKSIICCMLKADQIMWKIWGLPQGTHPPWTNLVAIYPVVKLTRKAVWALPPWGSIPPKVLALRWRP
jgi:hypothetical protein